MKSVILAAALLATVSIHADKPQAPAPGRYLGNANGTTVAEIIGLDAAGEQFKISITKISKNGNICEFESENGKKDGASIVASIGEGSNKCTVSIISDGQIFADTPYNIVATNCAANLPDCGAGVDLNTNGLKFVESE